MEKMITLNHGSGGRQSHELISDMFVSEFGIQAPLTDSAIFPAEGSMIAFTTDSYVINPVFFPGGNIGKLAICGTVNDLAVSGAVPKYISTGFILEEGFPLSDLERIAHSMALEAEKAGVKIITGDTKVVEKGKCDRLFINTAGTGFLKNEYRHISSGEKINTGDKIIVSGTMGNHAIAVLGARNDLGFTTEIESDCASLNHMIADILEQGADVHFMRDITRGGLASVLVELGRLSDRGIVIQEDVVPVDEPVRGLCEVLGFDPFYLANEGKILIVANENNSRKIINILRSHVEGRSSAIIGEITDDKDKNIIIETSGGGKRILILPSGIQLPRIC